MDLKFRNDNTLSSKDQVPHNKILVKQLVWKGHVTHNIYAIEIKKSKYHEG